MSLGTQRFPTGWGLSGAWRAPGAGQGKRNCLPRVWPCPMSAWRSFPELRCFSGAILAAKQPLQSRSLSGADFPFVCRSASGCTLLPVRWQADSCLPLCSDRVTGSHRNCWCWACLPSTGRAGATAPGKASSKRLHPSASPGL